MKNKILHTATADIPIYFDYPKKLIKVEPKCEKLITLKTNYTDGFYIYDDYVWSKGLISPAAIINVTNGKFITTVINSNSEGRIICNISRFKLKPYNNIYKKGKQNTNADAPSRTKLFQNSIESLSTVNSNDKKDDNLIDRLLQDVGAQTNENVAQVPLVPCNNNHINMEPDNNDRHNILISKTDEKTDNMGISIIEPGNLVSTNYSQTDNENKSLLVKYNDNDRQAKKFHLKRTPSSKYRVDNRSTNSRTLVKNVFTKVNNTENKIVTLEKEQKKNNIRKKYKVGETVYEQVVKTTLRDKAIPDFKGPYKIINLHSNNRTEIINNHPNTTSNRVRFKLLRRPHLVSGPS